jgi:DNA-binding NarL/FixJ family response regulator
MNTPEGEKIRVLLADDHALFRRGMAELLRDQPGFELVGEVGSGPEAVALAARSEPDVVLLDIHMPAGSGLEAVQPLKEGGDIKVLMLTVSDKDRDLMAAIKAGADGYLLKNAEPRQLFRAIRRVTEGESILSPEVTAKVMRWAAERPPAGEKVALSPREREVLQYLAQGKTSGEIASELVISISTVKTHVHHILQKLEAANRAEAVAKAASKGLLEDPPKG